MVRQTVLQASKTASGFQWASGSALPKRSLSAVPKTFAVLLCILLSSVHLSARGPTFSVSTDEYRYTGGPWYNPSTYIGQTNADLTLRGPVYKDSDTHFWYGTTEVKGDLEAWSSIAQPSTTVNTASLHMTSGIDDSSTTSSKTDILIYSPANGIKARSRTLQLTARVDVTNWLGGNENSQKTGSTITGEIDDTYPQYSMPSGPIYSNVLTTSFVVSGFTDSGSGISSGWYSLTQANGTKTVGNISNFASPLTITFAGSPGDNLCEVHVIDHVGHDTTQSLHFLVDQTPPTLAITLPPASVADSQAYSSFVVSVSASDSGGSGLSFWTTQLDNSSPVRISGASYTGTFTSEGQHNLTFSAIDKAGNVKTSQLISFLIDRTGPTVSQFSLVTDPPNPLNGYYRSLTVTEQAIDPSGLGTVADGVSQLEYSLDNRKSWSSGNTFHPTKDGVYALTFRATDKVGNPGYSVASIYKIDSAPPSATVIVPDTSTPNYYQSGPVEISVSASDPATGSGPGSGYDEVSTAFVADGISGTGSKVTLSGMGHHTVQFKLRDFVGNEITTGTKDIWLDDSKPSLDVQLGVPNQLGWTNTSDVPISIDANDTYSEVASITTSVVDSLGHKSVATYTGSSTLSLGANAAAGDFLVSVTAVDRAGNATTVGPQIVHYLPSVSAWTSPTFKAEWDTAAENETSSVTLSWTGISLPAGDSATYALSSAIAGVNLPSNASALLTARMTVEDYVPGDLEILIKLTATDLAGNQATVNKTFHNKTRLGAISNLQYSTMPSPDFGNVMTFQYDGTSGDILTATPSQSGAVAKTLPLAKGTNSLTGLTSHMGYSYQLRGLNSDGVPTTRNYQALLSIAPFTSQYPNTRPQGFTITAPTSGTHWIGPNAPLIWSQAEDPDHDKVVYTLHYGVQGSLDMTMTLPLTERKWTPPDLGDGSVTYAGFLVADDHSADGTISYGGTTTTPSFNFRYDSGLPALAFVPDTWPTTSYINGKGSGGNPLKVAVTASDDLSGLASLTGTIELTGADTAVAIAKNSDDTWSPWPEASGNYTFTLTALDNVQNSQTTVLKFDFDGTAPAVTSLTFDGFSRKVANRTVTFAGGTVSDDYSGVAKVEAQWSNNSVTGDWQTFSGTGMSLDLTGLGFVVNVPDGVYHLIIRVTDRAGNVARTLVPGDFVIDLTSLTTSLSVTGAVASNLGNIVKELDDLTVTAVSSDTVSGVAKTEYAVTSEGASPASWSSSWNAARDATVPVLVAGKWYEVQVKATNGVAGTLITKSARFMFDNTVPTDVTLAANRAEVHGLDSLRMLGSGSNSVSGTARYELTLGTLQSPTSVSEQMTGAVSGALILRDTPAPLWKLEIPNGLAPGQYLATMKVVGVNGLTSSQSVNVTILPGVSPIVVEDNGPYAAGLKAWFHADSADHFQVQLLDEEQNTVVAWKDLPDAKESFSAEVDLNDAEKRGLLNGRTYQMQVRAVSAQGDTGPVATSSGVLLDSTAPLVIAAQTVIHGKAGQTNLFSDGETLNLTWSVTPSQFSPLKSVALLVAKGTAVQKYSLPLIQDQIGDFTLSGLGTPLGLVTGDRLGLTLEVTSQAGVVADQELPAVFVNREAPPVAVVYRNNAFNNTHQPLRAQWATSANSAEIPLSYAWAVTKNPEALGSVSSWTVDDNSHSASVDADDLGAINGQIWYFVVRATSDTGKTSYGVSQGITIDSTRPMVAEVHLRDTMHIGVEPTFINSLDGLALVVDAFSQYSGVSEYLATFGTKDQGLFEKKGELGSSSGSPFVVEPADISLMFPDASKGTGYPNVPSYSPLVFAVSVTNEAQTTSLEPGYSAGVVFDTSAPAIGAVRIAVSGNQLLVDWESDRTRTAVPITRYSLQVFREGESFAVATLTTRNRSAAVDLSDVVTWTDGRYSVVVVATNAAGTASDGQDLNARRNFWIDRTPPKITASSAPAFVSTSMAFAATANNLASGIVQWRYQIGTQEDPGLLTSGWVTVRSNAKTLGMADTVLSLNHGVVVADASVLVAQVQVQSGAGFWSEIVTTSPAHVDLTPAAVTNVIAPFYTTLNNLVAPLSFTVTDDQSGVSAYRFGLRDEQNTLVGGTWATVSGLPGEHSVSIASANMSIPSEVTSVLSHGHAYRLVVQALNLASDIWTPEVSPGNLTIADLGAPIVTFDNPRSDGRVEQLLIGGQPLVEFVVNSLPLDLKVHISEDVGPFVTIDIQTFDAKGNMTPTADTLSGFPTTKLIHLDGNSPGVYTLVLTATDSAGNSKTTTQRVRLNSAPHVVLDPLTTTAGRPNTLAPTFLADIDNVSYGDTIVSHRWDFGDGSEQSTQAQPGHVYHQNSVGQAPGGYLLSYIAKDNWGAETKQQSWVTVAYTMNGSLYEDETWHGSQSVAGEVTIPVGVNLTLVSDANIQFAGNLVEGFGQGLVVNGTLVIADGATLAKAEGQDHIWNGILVSGTANIGDVEISDADRAVAIDSGGSANLIGTKLHDNETGLQVVGTASVTARGVQITNNRVYGVKEDSGGRPHVNNSTIIGNFENYYSWNGGALSIGEINTLGTNAGNQGE